MFQIESMFGLRFRGEGGIDVEQKAYFDHPYEHKILTELEDIGD